MIERIERSRIKTEIKLEYIDSKLEQNISQGEIVQTCVRVMHHRIKFFEYCSLNYLENKDVKGLITALPYICFVELLATMSEVMEAIYNKIQRESDPKRQFINRLTRDINMSRLPKPPKGR